MQEDAAHAATAQAGVTEAATAQAGVTEAGMMHAAVTHTAATEAATTGEISGIEAKEDGASIQIILEPRMIEKNSVRILDC